jgi:hypothetical protein
MTRSAFLGLIQNRSNTHLSNNAVCTILHADVPGKTGLMCVTEHRVRLTCLIPTDALFTFIQSHMNG